MLQLMSFIRIHDHYPILLYLVVDPQIPEYLSIRPLTAEDNQVVVHTDHCMPVSRRRSVSLLGSLVLPVWHSLFVAQLHDVVEEHLSASHVSHASEDPDCIVKLLAGGVVLTAFEHCGSFSADDPEFLDFVDSCDDFSSELAEVGLDVDVDCGGLVDIAEVVDEIVVKNVSIFDLNQRGENGSLVD